MNVAALYYLLMTGKNVSRQAVRSLISPRYILALVTAVLVVLFLWFMLSSARDSSQNGFRDVGIALRQRLIALHAISLLHWLEVSYRCASLPFSGGVSSLARLLGFRRSEVEYLFQAPLTRRQVIYFKVAAMLWQSCAGAAVYATVLALLYPGISFVKALLGLVLAMNAIGLLYLALHLCTSFLASKNLPYVVSLFAAGFVAGFFYLLFQSFVQAHTQFGMLSRVAETPAFQVLIRPMTFLFAPACSESWLQFLRTLWQPLLVAAATGLIFFTRQFRFDYFEEAFETTQRESSAQPELRRASEAMPTPESRNQSVGLLRLRPTGPQWRAVVWKSLKAGASRKRRSALSVPLTVLATALALCLVPRSDGFQLIVSALLYTLIISVVLVGPRLIRNGGLRSDLRYFDLLKSMPISGRQLLFGEVAVQLAILFGVVALGTSVLALRERIPPVGFLFACFSLIAVRVTVHNLFALYFPNLVKLDPAGKESDYRFIVRGALSILIIALLLVVPVGVGAAIAVIGPSVLDVEPIVLANPARASVAVLLVLELFALIFFSEGRYQRFDISQENTAH